MMILEDGSTMFVKVYRYSACTVLVLCCERNGCVRFLASADSYVR